MKKIFIIFFQELKILIKDRQALALLFVMPLALIVFLTLAMQDIYQAKIGRQILLNVVSNKPCDNEDSTCAMLIEKLKKFNYKTPNQIFLEKVALIS